MCIQKRIDTGENERSKDNRCQVCGVTPAKTHYGAVTCYSCSYFFAYTVKEGKTYRCENNGDCDSTGKVNRLLCLSCRYDRCIKVGMQRKIVGSRCKQYDTPEEMKIGDKCKVCGREAKGIYYGVLSCSGCKCLFRRMVKGWTKMDLNCPGNCGISGAAQRECKVCRFKKCIISGMRPPRSL